MHESNLADKPDKIPVIILAGGLGSRLSEETSALPKPMLRIGGLPILIHIMDFYSRHGFFNFVICGGYKVEEIKKYFLTLPYMEKNIEISFSEDAHHIMTKKTIQPIFSHRNKWHVTILDTGLHSQTGSRIRQAFDYLDNKQDYENVCLTYGDGLTNVNLRTQMQFHFSHNRLATVLAVHSPSRFGIFDFENNSSTVKSFLEKPKEYINGGFFFLRKECKNLLPEDDINCIFEQAPLQKLAESGQLEAFKYDGFWQCMDTKREMDLLEKLWQQGPPWLNN